MMSPNRVALDALKEQYETASIANTSARSQSWNMDSCALLD